MSVILTVGQKLTMFHIDNVLAMTHRTEYQVRAVGSDGKLLTLRQRGKRKDVRLGANSLTNAIVLDGWDLSIKADTECGGAVWGNACFNIVGDPLVVRKLIDTQAVWPVSDRIRAQVIVYRKPSTSAGDDNGELLYPDLEAQSAVIDGIKERRGIGRHAKVVTDDDRSFGPAGPPPGWDSLAYEDGHSDADPGL